MEACSGEPSQPGVLHIEILLELVFSVIGESLFQLGGEFLLELLARAVAGGVRSDRRANPIAAACGLVLLGALIGLLSWLVLPNRIFEQRGLPGASIVFSPIVTGVVMEAYGRHRELRGRTRSYLATFWGGGLFALSMSGVRFLLVGPGTN